ncbi:TlpA family protein disulfide reductase [Sphingobacterium thalpophilum]|uniref:TlpA family protein disulfide reductase n=1 Tax=Sphingobacterium thalpophilum TaxID=259 RepID=UPI002D78839B|nr:TlpA disulfide reductase family protein [Sphingobacterium thalpophilum]
MFSLSAQTPRKDSGADGLTGLVALKPGDKIPDAVWNQPLELNYFNGKKKTIKFAELKGKLILLDFWSTWCPSCIEGFPHLDEILAKKKGEIAVLLVNSADTRDTRPRVDQLIKKYREKYDYESSLPYLLGDSIFKKLFPHNALPHLVWVSKDGVLIANTYPSALTNENIDAILRNGSARLHEKEILKDTDLSFFADNALYAGSVFKRYQEGLMPAQGKYIFKGGQTRFQIINQSFPFLLAMAFQDELRGIPWRLWVFDKYAGRKQDLLRFDQSHNRFCYEMIVKDSLSKAKAKQIFMTDFKQFFGLQMSVENDLTDVWNISANREIEKIKSKNKIPEVFIGGIKSGMRFRNIPLELLIDNLSLYFAWPIILNIPDGLRIDIDIPGDFGDWGEDSKVEFLRNIGLDFQHTRKLIRYARFSSNKSEVIW